MLDPEPEILDGRHNFNDAQVTFNHAADTVWPSLVSVSWYGTRVSDERGSFAHVRTGGPLADLVGDHLRITSASRSVNVYVLGATDALVTDLAITRRAFVALGLLSTVSLPCKVEVLT